jgi:hypothetical protein
MILDAMRAIDADGVAVCEAHPDLEVFRLRLGKALNYEYNEDSQTALFQRRDPREGGPALDVERALNKLEKVALSAARRKGRPLVLVLNNVHFFNNDEAGRNMLLQLQQKAESWAANGDCVFTQCRTCMLRKALRHFDHGFQLVSCFSVHQDRVLILFSDDAWPFFHLRKTASRMHVRSSLPAHLPLTQCASRLRLFMTSTTARRCTPRCECARVHIMR